MSWKMEVLDKDGWATNSLRYATEQEALNAGCELLSRWIVGPKDYRATETPDEPVNYRFDTETWRNVRLDKPVEV